MKLLNQTAIGVLMAAVDHVHTDGNPCRLASMILINLNLKCPWISLSL